MISKVEHIFIPVHHLYIFFGNSPNPPGLLTIFSIGLFAFFFAIELCEFFVYFWYKPLISIVCKYFLPFHRLSLILLIVSFAVKKLLGLMQSFLFIFGFGACALGVISKTPCQDPHQGVIIPLFPFRSLWFQVLHLNL